MPRLKKKKNVKREGAGEVVTEELRVAAPPKETGEDYCVVR